MSPLTRRRLRRAGLAVASLGLAMVVVVTATLPTARWRAQVVLLKVRGRLPEIAWGELLGMLGPSAPVYLEPLVENPNPYAVIRNPYRTVDDAAAGAERFRASCGSCHGGDRGPDLSTGTFRHGASDWALYRTITRGVPGTAMPGHDLSSRDAWRLVAFVRSLAENPADTARTVPPPGAAVRPIAAAELSRPPGADWLTYSGTYAAHRHSTLTQITPANAPSLGAAWLLQLPGTDDPVETTPLVIDGIMFLTVPPQQVLAVDLRTRRILWSWKQSLPADLAVCCNLVNRGLAVRDSTLYVGTLAAHLVALDARTGAVRWDIEVAAHAQGYSITAAPLVVGDMVITGIAGGEYGIRGFIDAYDAATGARRWRFYTVPAPGEPGSETWTADSWRTGGAPTWLTGAYDPALGLLYWGVGNPGPNYTGDTRPGDNLYSNSVVALEAATGALRWHFQFTPHDEHDWDAVQIPVLADVAVGDAVRPALLFANRNAFYYVLDRATGALLTVRPVARQTWADSLDARGRPWPRADARPSRTGTLVWPSVSGATNWWSPAYSPALSLLYVPILERPGIFFAGEAVHQPGQPFTGSASQGVLGEPFYAGVRALRPATGDLAWEYRFPLRTDRSTIGGVLSTAGGVVFAGDRNTFYALDARTGRELWTFDTGGLILAAPVTYLVDGRQYVAIPGGNTLIAFAVARTR
jgi:alcohol dehydrogenase (cytochrome c)